MEKILLVLLCLMAIAFGETINVINDDQQALIYVDGKLAGAQTVYDLAVEPGSHHIKVEKDKRVIYSQIVEVEAGKVKTINTSTFVDVKTDVTNRGAKLTEAKRARESRGDLAVGVLLSPIVSGISGKYFVADRLGFQVSGWLSSQSASNSFSTLGLRAIYTLSDTLAGSRTISLYSFAGAGNNINVVNSVEDLKEVIELGFGIESQFRSAATSDTIFGVFMSLLNDSYLDFEFAYNRHLQNHGVAFDGIVLSGGIMFYF